MKREILFLISMAALLVAPMSVRAGDYPTRLGGCMLGADINDYKGPIKRDTAMPIRYMTYLTEVETGKMKGYKSGLIAYGNCADPGRIVRVKFKYSDSSRKFYDNLLSRFKERYGEPTEWRGDPFHIVVAWKWSFLDSEKRRISMILQHNTRDSEQKMGNSVKITLSSLLEEERRCFEKKRSHNRSRGENRNSGNGPVSWDNLIPR